MKYKAYNLLLSVPFECPELMLAEAEDEHLESVIVTYGKVPDTLTAPLNHGITFEANETELLLTVKEVGRYYVQDGCRMTIEKEDNASDDAVRCFFFASALVALLHQRGDLVLNASAIQTDKGAILFAGTSGSGKSTLLQEFVKRGYKQLCDTSALLYRDASTSQFFCTPSYPSVTLWKHSLDLLNMDHEGLQKTGPESSQYLLSNREHFCPDPLPLHRIFILSTHSESHISINEIEHFKKYMTIIRQIHYGRFVSRLFQEKVHFQLAVTAAAQAAVFRLKRPNFSNTLTEFADRIEETFV